MLATSLNHSFSALNSTPSPRLLKLLVTSPCLFSTRPTFSLSTVLLSRSAKVLATSVTLLAGTREIQSFPRNTKRHLATRPSSEPSNFFFPFPLLPLPCVSIISFFFSTGRHDPVVFHPRSTDRIFYLHWSKRLTVLVAPTSSLPPPIIDSKSWLVKFKWPVRARRTFYSSTALSSTLSDFPRSL